MKIKSSKTAHFSTSILFKSKELSSDIFDFKGDAEEISVRYQNEQTLIYCGLGEKQLVTSTILRTTAALAIRKVIDLKRDQVSVLLDEELITTPDAQKAVMEGIWLGSYKFDLYKSEKSHRVTTVEITGTVSNTNLHHAEVLCNSINYARDLINENASTVTPERFAAEAKKLAKVGCKITILDEIEMKKQGLGLIYAVGQGSPTPPRLIFIEYSGNARSKEKTAIVGKGVTFDSGGQNLKPTGHIETMRSDMAGAAAVLGLMNALSTLKPSINVIGVIGAAHNAIGENTFFPGDVYKSYAGKTVEIHSTDAEGRLVLADAVAYCQKNFKPTSIIDLATLTGGVLSALGELVAGLFSNDDDLANRLFDAGEKTNERLWRFPLYKGYSDALKGDLADLRNLSKFKKGYASSITGAAFIKEFIQDIPWAHLDIAGTAFNEGSSRGEIPQFGTGFGIRLLMEFLLNKG
jgi:leucyl aminopeptidase